jgi:hypothetical protein
MDVLTSYFHGEKTAGLVLAGIGLTAAVAAALMFPARWELRAMAITCAVWALLELAVGLGLYFKTGPQLDQLVAQLGSDPVALFAAELPRMVKVQRNFLVIELVWLTAIVCGAAIAVWRKGDPRVSGVALAVVIHAAVFLAFDIIAERRGALYLDALQKKQLDR